MNGISNGEIHVGGDAEHSILVSGSHNVIFQAQEVMVQAAEKARTARQDPTRMLRVLAVLAAPVYDPDQPDSIPPPLDLKQEWHVLAQNIRRSNAPILLARLIPPTLEHLRLALSPGIERKEHFPHILHFSGHAWAGGLFLEDELGRLHQVSTEELLEALGLPRPLDLVVLNGCETAADVQSVAQTLVEKGLARAAVGHTRPVLDPQAIAFAARLYAELAHGFTLREAVDRARKAVTTHPVALLGDGRLCFRDYLSPGQPVIDDRRPRGKIPPRGAFFFGRGKELVEIARHLAHPPKIIVVSGPAGIGKTSLLIEAAHRNAWRFPGGVAFAKGPRPEEGRRGMATGLLIELAASLGIEATPRDVADKLREHTAFSPTLLVLDNVESLPRPEQEKLARFLRWLGDESAALLALGSPSPALENLPAAVPFPLHRGLATEPALRYALALAGQRDIPLNVEQAMEVVEATGGHPRLIELILDQNRVRDRDALLAEVRKRKGDFAAQLQLVRTWRGEAMPLVNLPPMVEVFIGREREKNEFRRALEGVLRMTEANKDADWAQVFFIWGEGGMGKSTLLGEYVKMCEAYADQLFWLYVDWESTGVTSQSGTFGMMRLIKERLVKRYQVDFSNFCAIEIERLRVLREIEGLCTIFTGDSQEQFKRFVKAHLSERDYSFYDQRESQRRLSEAFVSDLNQLAAERPVVLMFDSYETVWHFADEWVRGGLFRYCLGNPEVGRRFIIVIAGRLPEEVESRHRDDARRYIRPLAYFHKALDKFTEDDIRDFLSQVVPDQPLSNSLVSRIHTITRGIPLAVNEVAAIIRTEGNIEQVFGDIREPLADHKVVPLVTQRFLKYLPQQTPEGIRDRDCIYTFAIVRESKTSESDRGIITRREKFLRDIWFRCRLVSSSEEFYRIKQHLRERYSFLFPGGNMHPDVRFFVRKALHQAIIEPGKLVEINEAAKTICELKLKERVKQLEARYGPEKAAREKYKDSLWQEWLLDLVSHRLWLQEYDDAIEIIINEYVMAMQYGSEGFHRRLLSLLQDDELLYDALPARHKELIERLSNLQEWAGRLKMDAEREKLLELLRGEARLAGLLIAARAAADVGEFEAAWRQIVEAERLYRIGGQVNRAFESDLAAAYHLLGRRLASSSRKRQVQLDSLDLLKKARDWSPDDPHIRCALGKVLINLQLLVLAKREFETALRLSGGTSKEAREGLNRVEHLEKLRHFHPRKQARILTVEGNALSARGEFDEAKRLFEAAMRSDSSYVPARVKLSHLLRYEGDAEKALALLDEINIAEISENYLRATVYDAYGAIFLALEQFDRAIEAYQTAIKLSPEYINPLNGLGRTYVRLGKGQEAIEMFELALKVKRRSQVPLRTSLFWVYNGLGMAYLLANQPNGAIESFQFAELLCKRHLDRKSLRYYTLANLGIALLGQHRYEESLDAFKRFATTSKPRGLIHELLADIQLIGKFYGKTIGWQQIAAFVTSLL